MTYLLPCTILPMHVHKTCAPMSLKHIIKHTSIYLIAVDLDSKGLLCLNI